MGFRSLAALLREYDEPRAKYSFEYHQFCPFFSFLIRHLDCSRFKCATVRVCERARLWVSVLVYAFEYFLHLLSLSVTVFFISSPVSLSLPFFISFALSARTKKAFILVAGSLKGFSCDLFMLAWIFSALHLLAHFHRSFSFWFAFGWIFHYVLLCSIAVQYFFHLLHFSYISCRSNVIYSIFCVVLTGWWICFCEHSILKWISTNLFPFFFM